MYNIISIKASTTRGWTIRALVMLDSDDEQDRDDISNQQCILWLYASAHFDPGVVLFGDKS